MAIYATAGAKLFIGGPLASKPADFVLADFAAQSWIEVSWVENMGAVGDESATINFDAIGQGRTIKLKGQRNAGDMAIVCGVDYADAGQIAVRAAEATPLDYAFMVQFDDAPVGGSPSSRQFVARVMTVREQLDTANNVIKMQMALGVNSNIVRVNAA